MARAEGTVNIEVKGALQGALEVRTLSKALDKLDNSGKKLSSGAKTIQTYTQNLTTAGVKTRKVFDSMDKGIKMMGMGLTKGLMLALKATVLQFGVFSLALMGVHALFIAGKYLHKAYSWGMTAMAGAAASAAVALGTAAAAIREQQAAMFAFTAGGAGEFITGTNQVRNAMRTLQSDSQLAGLGVAALNKAYASMAKSMKSSQIAQSGAMLKNLMDFGAAGQDPAAAADKVGALIEALNNSKTSMASVKQAAKALGPQMEQALKKAKVTSKKQMKELIMSGELAKAGGVAGQFEAVNSTLIGQAKSFFTQIKGEFADFGQQFLEPAKVAMQKIFKIIRTDLMRVSGSLGEFGKGNFFDGIVTVFEKVSNFFVKLLRDWLPKTDGFFKNMGGSWEKFARWFRISREQLRPFVEGAKAVEGIFKPILSALKSGFLDSFKDFNQGAISNKETFAEIGENLGGLITELFKLSAVFSKAFRDALPFLSDVIKGITSVISMITGMLSKFSGILGGPMAYMALLLMGRQMKNHKGGFLGKERAPVNTMNVTATTVNVGGRPIPGGPGGGPGGPNGPGGPGTRPIPGGPTQPGLGRGPLAIGQGQRAIGPGGGGNLPVPYTQGKVMYDNQGRPLTGGRRHVFDFRRPGSDYPNKDAKLVGRGASYIDPRSGKRVLNPGAFKRLIPGSGIAGTTGRVYEQAGRGRQLAIGAGPSAAGVSSASSDALGAVSGASQRRVLLMQQRYQNLGPGVERDQAAAWLSGRGHALTPPAGGGGGTRFSSGATPGPGGGGGGGMPGPGGPGTAPPGAGGPGTPSPSRVKGLWARMNAGATQQAQGNTGLGNDLFRTKITGRQYARAETDANGEYTGRVMNLSRKIDPITGNRMTTGQGATYDPQTGMVSTKGMSMKNKMKYSGLTTRSIRNGALGSAVLGNADKGIGGINNSMGAKMAVGMGMSMASQYMPKEAQGAMALGGMVGQFNPLAGMAVGLGGAALSSRTAGGGALTGAGAGAAIGTMIAPGIGTAVGAALGAITGAIAGFTNGMAVRAAEAKKAVNSFISGISFNEFKSAGLKLKQNEKDAALGIDMSNRKGALEDVAAGQATKYNDIQKRFNDEGISLDDLDLEGKADRRAGNQNQIGLSGYGKAGRAKGFGKVMRHLSGGSTLGLAKRGISQIKRGLNPFNNEIDKDNEIQEKGMKVVDDIRNDPMYKGLISDEDYSKMKKSPKSGLTEIGKKLAPAIEASNEIADQSAKRMKMLKDMSGKSGAELEALAKSMGVNLYDPTIKMTDLVEKLGMTVMKTAAQLKNANIDASIKGISDGFDKAIQKANAPKIYNERGRSVFDVVQGGGDTASVLEALKGFQESSLNMSDSPIDAFYNQQDQLGTASAPGRLFRANGAFAKMDPAKFFTPEVQAALAEQAKSTEKGFTTTATDQINSGFMNSGMMTNQAQLSGIVNSMDATNKKKFYKDVESGAFDVKDPFANKSEAETQAILTKAGVTTKGEEGKTDFFEQRTNKQLQNYGVQNAGIQLFGIDKGTNDVADKMATAGEDFKAAVEMFSANMGSYFTDSAGKPEWWSKDAMKEIMKGDTSTPRGGSVGDTTSSRLSQTMARHNSINGSIAGNRSITSSYRTYGLGSLNSDHVTGRAIDLVGQNLGSYAVATRNAGGFAEFHGSGAVRHLHAVPGPGAIGDTLTPVSNQMGGATSATVTSGSNSFTFHINGGQNNPEEIASMVMAKIQNSEQRIRERS